MANLEVSESLKRQIYGTWLARWLNHFENDVSLTIFQEFLKLHSHISVFWGFRWFLWFPSFRFGYRAQNENPEIMEMLYLCVCKVEIRVILVKKAKAKIWKKFFQLPNLSKLVFVTIWAWKLQCAQVLRNLI